jgi:glycosyltransferase involved in cell wall biosynthesis
MKIITLITFRNEEHFLKTPIQSVANITDEVVCINDKSTDNSQKVAEELGASVYENTHNNELGSTENEIRNNLLNLGREHNGTHFIILDADEALSSNFENNIQLIRDLVPGQSMELQWLAMWKSLTRFKDDKSVWSNSFKDFIYCDDIRLNLTDTIFKNKDYKKHDIAWPTHPPRTPGISKVRFNRNIGAVLHFQFSNWEAFQLKQCWYRCAELIQNDGTGSEEINKKYKITLEKSGFRTNLINKFKTKEAPQSLYKDTEFPDLDKIYDQYLWRLDQISGWFKDFGKEYFKDLNIWHVEAIKNIET